MKYTKEQLTEMSDLEINLAVAEKLGYKARVVNDTFVEVKQINRTWDWLFFNPCEDWYDVMPIAEKYGIDINFIKPANNPLALRFEIASNNKNHRRAICEVFLMMDKDN